MSKKLNPMAVKCAWIYDTEELARALGVTPGTIRNMVRRGMPVLAGQTPYLFIGEAVREFIRSERAANKQPLAMDQLFCPSCRKGRRPMGMMADLVHINTKTSRLEGLCERCEGRANRTIKAVRISEFTAIFDITERAMSET